MCAALAPPYYASNAFLLLSPLLMLLMNNTRAWVQAVLAAMSIASTLFVFVAPICYEDFHRYPDLPGFYVWAAAHGILTVAFCIPTGGFARKTRGRAFQVVQMDEASH
jgi:apolipoprotein N-acyltransferase